MFWIFANDKDNSLAPNNTALGTTFANGGRNFHNSISLLAACLMTAKGLIILAIFIAVYISFTVACRFVHKTVRMSGSPSVTATVCSKCAVKEPSADTTVH